MGGLEISLCDPNLNGRDIEMALRKSPYAFNVAYIGPRSIQVDAFTELQNIMDPAWAAEVRSRIWALCYTHNAMGYCFDTAFSPDLSEEEAVEGLKLLFTTSFRLIVVTTNDDKKEAGNWRALDYAAQRGVRSLEDGNVLR